MDQVCANYVKCPIYNGILKDLAFTSEAYRKLYCDAGAAVPCEAEDRQVPREVVAEFPEVSGRHHSILQVGVALPAAWKYLQSTRSSEQN